MLFLTPDSLLVRLIDATPMAICFWRGLLAGCLLLITYLVYSFFHKSQKSIKFSLKEMLIILCIALSTICFVLAVNFTTIANTLFLLSTAPFFSIFLSYFLLGERLKVGDLFASLVALFGIFVISLESQFSTQTSANWLGDFFGICIAVFTALVLTLVRHAPPKLVLRSNAIGMNLTALLVFPLVSDFSVEIGTILYLLILSLLCVPIGSFLILTGPKFISSPEVSLILLLQVIIGPILAWFVLKENVGLISLIGGILVLVAIIVPNIRNICKG